MAAIKRLSLASVLRRAVRAHALGGRAATVVEAVWRAGFVYGSAPTCHLAAVARTGAYTVANFRDAVVKHRELVRVRAMRGAVYLMPRELVPHALCLTPLRPPVHYARLAGISVRELAALARRIEQIVTNKPHTATEIREALGNKAPRGTGLSSVLAKMSREARIVRTAVRGGARSQAYEYARMADWIDLPEERPSLAKALKALARPWLLANGPATAADLAWWAGVSKHDAAAALNAIGARPVTVKDMPGANREELLANKELLGDFAKVPRNDEIHLVPCWDSYLMAHRDRSRYLDDAHRPLVLDKMGNFTHAVLRGGRVCGIWDLDGTTLLHAPFEKISRRALEVAAQQLAPLHEITSLRQVEDPQPLAGRKKNAFLAPLR
ncbi:MAG: DNA glycosylase AlkZ-like family protein [Planctomycetota bacterium]|jgi:hypothetical protein